MKKDAEEAFVEAINEQGAQGVSYRKNAAPPAAIVLARPPQEHRGIRDRCPVCAQGRVVQYSSRPPGQDGKTMAGPTYGEACVGAPWWRRIFSLGCRRFTVHLHQRCVTCGAKWMCAPKEDL